MKRILASIILGGFFFVPALASADGPRTTAFVHVHGDDRAALETPSQNGEWREVCSAPCDRALPLGVQYRIGGDGVRPSAPFYLSRGGERVDLDVNLATTQGHHAGIALGAIGGGGVALGVLLFAFGSMQQYTGYTTTTIPTTSGLVTVPTGVTQSGPDTGLMTAGGVVMGIGAAFAIGGLVLAAVNSKTTVQQLTYVAASRSEVAVAPRTPVWHQARSAPDATRPMMVPLFSGTF